MFGYADQAYNVAADQTAWPYYHLWIPSQYENDLSSENRRKAAGSRLCVLVTATMVAIEDDKPPSDPKQHQVQTDSADRRRAGEG